MHIHIQEETDQRKNQQEAHGPHHSPEKQF